MVLDLSIQKNGVTTCVSVLGRCGKHHTLGLQPHTLWSPGLEVRSPSSRGRQGWFPLQEGLSKLLCQLPVAAAVCGGPWLLLHPPLSSFMSHAFSLCVRLCPNVPLL